MKWSAWYIILQEARFIMRLTKYPSSIVPVDSVPANTTLSPVHLSAQTLVVASYKEFMILTGKIIKKLEPVSVSISTILVAKKSHGNGVSDRENAQLCPRLDCRARPGPLEAQHIGLLGRNYRAWIEAEYFWNLVMAMGHLIVTDHSVNQEICNKLVKSDLRMKHTSISRWSVSIYWLCLRICLKHWTNGNEIIFGSSQKGSASLTYDYGNNPVKKCLESCIATGHRRDGKCGEQIVAYQYYVAHEVGSPGFIDLKDQHALSAAAADIDQGTQIVNPCGTPVSCLGDDKVPQWGHHERMQISHRATEAAKISWQPKT